jgi:predicted nucleic acid-binding protein
VIIVDSNIIAYCWINGVRTSVAQRVRLSDPEWHSPILWRSELRNILTGYLRQGSIDVGQATAVMGAAEESLAGREHLVASDAVLQLAAETRLSAYDWEFVVLAEALGVPLVTEDREVLKAFPDIAMTMESFLDREERTPPEAHATRAHYRVRKRLRRASAVSGKSR